MQGNIFEEMADFIGSVNRQVADERRKYSEKIAELEKKVADLERKLKRVREPDNEKEKE